MSEQQTIDNINEALDRIEAKMDSMNEKLNMIMDEINKHKNGPSKTITTTYDGEIMYRFKHNDKLK